MDSEANIQIKEMTSGKKEVSNTILRSLPLWFGIEQAILDYCEHVESLPMFIAQVKGEVIGFISIESHNPSTQEVHVMGIKPKFHRLGIGSALIKAAEQYAIDHGARLLMVKTLGPSNSTPEYDKTRTFYLNQGFLPLQEFETIWNRENPCLVMAKVLSTAPPKNNKIVNWKPPVLTTRHLTLRPIELSDADAIFQYAKNPAVSRYTLWEPHQKIEDTIDYIQNYIFDYYRNGVPEAYGITFSETPAIVIGTVGCFWVSKKSKSMELAYALTEDQWGKGIIVEASNAVMDFCQKNFGLKRIQARCKSENAQSARVMDKLGMQFEGVLRSSILHRKQYWNMMMYSKVYSHNGEKA